jgi:cold shock protein
MFHCYNPKVFDLRFSHVERRSKRIAARQNVADRYYDQPGSTLEVMGTGQRVSGTVKFFNPDKGYGFIRRDGGQDVFVHANELRKSGIMDLSPITTGAKLEFEIDMAGKGPKAVNIALLCDADEE